VLLRPQEPFNLGKTCILQCKDLADKNHRMGGFIPLIVLAMILDPFINAIKYFILSPVTPSLSLPRCQLTKAETVLQYLPTTTRSHARRYPPPSSGETTSTSQTRHWSIYILRPANLCPLYPRSNHLSLPPDRRPPNRECSSTITYRRARV
jgi:hypothetical protein